MAIRQVDIKSYSATWIGLQSKALWQPGLHLLEDDASPRLGRFVGMAGDGNSPERSDWSEFLLVKIQLWFLNHNFWVD